MDDLIKYWILCLIRAVLFCIEAATDLLFGYTFTKGSKEERRKAESYESSAQVVSIIWKAKHTLLKVSRLHYFLYKHEEYVHPDYVLKNKHATLLAVEKDYALFSVNDASVDIHDSKKFPFLFLAQFSEAKKLVIMPIKTFHRLADELGDPKVPVAIAAMTARCGSTLLVQILNRIPNTRSMSENWATCNLHDLMCADQLTLDEYRRLLKSAIRLHCKVEPGSGVERIFIKLTTMNAPMFGDIAKMFPEIKLIFNTRHPLPSLKSMKQLIDTTLDSLYYKLGYQWREFVPMANHMSYDGKYDYMAKKYNWWRQNVSNEELGILVYAWSLTAYFENPTIYDRIVLYENFTSNTEEEILQLFDILDIEHKHLPLGLEALKKDSQNGTFGARGKGRSFVLEPELLETLDCYMEEMKIPKIRHEMSECEFKSIFGF